MNQICTKESSIFKVLSYCLFIIYFCFNNLMMMIDRKEKKQQHRERLLNVTEKNLSFFFLLYSIHSRDYRLSLLLIEKYSIEFSLTISTFVIVCGEFRCYKEMFSIANFPFISCGVYLFNTSGNKKQIEIIFFLFVNRTFRSI